MTDLSRMDELIAEHLEGIDVKSTTVDELYNFAHVVTNLLYKGSPRDGEYLSIFGKVFTAVNKQFY